MSRVISLCQAFSFRFLSLLSNPSRHKPSFAFFYRFGKSQARFGSDLTMVVFAVVFLSMESPEPFEPLDLFLPNASLQLVARISASRVDDSVFSINGIIVLASSIHLALVRSLTAVCRLIPGFIPANGNMSLLSPPLWQSRGKLSDYSVSQVYLISFLEHVSPLYFPPVLSGFVAGASLLKVTNALAFAMLKSSSKWCFVTSDRRAKVLIDNSALVAGSIHGIRSLNMLSNSEGIISLYSNLVIGFRGRLHDFVCLSVLYVVILCIHVYDLCFAVVAADRLASLALSFDVNNYSIDGE